MAPYSPVLKEELQDRVMTLELLLTLELTTVAFYLFWGQLPRSDLEGTSGKAGEPASSLPSLTHLNLLIGTVPVSQCP